MNSGLANHMADGSSERFECSRAQKDLERFLKRDLGPGGTRKLRDHLSACDGCSLDYHKVGKRLIESILLTCPENPPSGIYETLREVLWGEWAEKEDALGDKQRGDCGCEAEHQNSVPHIEQQPLRSFIAAGPRSAAARQAVRVATAEAAARLRAENAARAASVKNEQQKNEQQKNEQQ